MHEHCTLVAETICALHCVIHTPLPRIIGERASHATLCRDRVAARRETLPNAAGLCGAQACTTRTDNDNVVHMINDRIGLIHVVQGSNRAVPTWAGRPPMLGARPSRRAASLR